MDKLAKLRVLNCFNNKMKKLPPELGKLTRLKEVTCANLQCPPYLCLPYSPCFTELAVHAVCTMLTVATVPTVTHAAHILICTRTLEVNAAANQLMMLTDAHFAAWASVEILTLNDNRLVRLGSLAPLTSLEELRTPKATNHHSPLLP